jgi:hypothetical protein
MDGRAEMSRSLENTHRVFKRRRTSIASSEARLHELARSSPNVMGDGGRLGVYHFAMRKYESKPSHNDNLLTTN